MSETLRCLKSRHTLSDLASRVERQRDPILVTRTGARRSSY